MPPLSVVSVRVPLSQAVPVTREVGICVNGPPTPPTNSHPHDYPQVAYEERSPDYCLCNIYPSSLRSEGKVRHQTHTNATTPNNRP